MPRLLLMGLFAVLTACGGGGGAPSIGVILDDTLGAPMHTAVAVGDVDADGMADVVSVSNTLAPERIRLNVYIQQAGGQGTFAPKDEYLIGTQPTLRAFDLVIADLNVDAAPDIVMSHMGIGSGGIAPGTQVSVLLQDPANAGRFRSPVVYDVGESPRGIAVGDLDLDGLPDLVVATRDGLYLLRQHGGNQGAFLASFPISSASTEAVQIGDLDNDGLPDLACGEGQTIQVYLNDPASVGSFLVGSSAVTGGSPNDLALVDLDADGRLDVVVSNYRSTAAGERGSVSVLLQDPIIDGAFPGFTEYAVNQAFRMNSIAAADLDGDQRPDIAGAVQSLVGANDKLVVLLQTAAGIGAFAAPVSYSHPGVNDPWMAVVADLGPDALPDLVLANALDGVYALYQDPAGVGTFASGIKIGE